jgi:DNA-binding FadR family transcriptional regulator
MYQLLHHFRQLGFQTQKARESATRFHLALIDALSVRDLEEAEKILNDHLIEGKKITVSYIINGQ